MMQGLRAAVIGGLACAALAVPQRPTEEDAAAGIEKSRQTALDYGRSLPDFVCTEVVNRYIDPRRHGAWLPQDKLTVKLSYFEQQEEHKLILLDGKPTSRDYRSLGGAVGMGEFGGMLQGIFEPRSAARFHWENWKNVRKHRAAVYSYVVQPEHSAYLMVSGVPGAASQQALVGFHGTLEIDSETGAVLAFTYDADKIPPALGIDSVRSSVDYDFAGVGGNTYLLPVRSATKTRTPHLWVLNRIEFREYRKFSTESNISFGDGK